MRGGPRWCGSGTGSCRVDSRERLRDELHAGEERKLPALSNSMVSFTDKE